MISHISIFSQILCRKTKVQNLLFLGLYLDIILDVTAEFHANNRRSPRRFRS